MEPAPLCAAITTAPVTQPIVIDERDMDVAAMRSQDRATREVRCDSHALTKLSAAVPGASTGGPGQSSVDAVAIHQHAIAPPIHDVQHPGVSIRGKRGW